MVTGTAGLGQAQMGFGKDSCLDKFKDSTRHRVQFGRQLDNGAKERSLATIITESSNGPTEKEMGVKQRDTDFCCLAHSKKAESRIVLFKNCAKSLMQNHALQRLGMCIRHQKYLEVFRVNRKELRRVILHATS